MAGELAGRAKRIHRKLIDLRRTIHKHPELAFEETKTAALIAKTLRRIGLKVKSGVAKTGVMPSAYPTSNSIPSETSPAILLGSRLTMNKACFPSISRGS